MNPSPTRQWIAFEFARTWLERYGTVPVITMTFLDGELRIIQPECSVGTLSVQWLGTEDDHLRVDTIEQWRERIRQRVMECHRLRWERASPEERVQLAIERLSSPITMPSNGPVIVSWKQP